MDDNLFEQLALSEIPPVPREFDLDVHRRLNSTLLIAHLFEFTWRAFPRAAGMMLASVLHLITFTITGHLETDTDGHKRKQL